MFELLLLKVTQVHNRISDIEEEIDSNSKLSIKEKDSIKKCNRKVDNLSESVYDLMQVAIKNDYEVHQIKTKLHKLEVRFQKGSIVIKGIPEKEIEDCKQVAQDFIKNQLEIQNGLEIQTAYRIGRSKRSPLFVKLLDPNKIGVIFKHVKNLKEKTNDQEMPFSIDEQLTEKEFADKTRQQDIKKENQQLPPSHQKDILRKGRDLLVDNVKYVKKIEPPTAKETLVVSRKEQDDFRSINTVESDIESFEGSRFKAYFAVTKNFNDVKRAYKKVKEANLAAAHILCTWRICHPDFHDRQDYSDDGDYNMGREILYSLKFQGVINVTVFVVRYYDGKHIGPEHFNIVQRLTHNVLSKVPLIMVKGSPTRNW